jgi:prepilin-type N-terminal cleavage/methylation domain-containing protein
MSDHRKRELVHFLRRIARRPEAASKKWKRKGDRSIFPLPINAVSRIRRKNGPVPFSGFTLLEIILSLAILAGALAALGEVMRLADRNAQLVRDESQAQILASSVMDELLSGTRQPTTVNQELFDYNTDPPWLYSIAFDQTPYVELVLARVRVEQQLPPEQQPAHFELVRWVPNPDYIPPETQQSSSTTSSSSGKKSAGSQSSSSSGGAGGQTGGVGP